MPAPRSLNASRPSVARRTAAARAQARECLRDAQRAKTSSPAAASATFTMAASPDSLRAFTQQVALATMGPCLRYSQRLQLLALAQRAGIRRFDANLIIAALEDRAGHQNHRPVAQSTTSIKPRAIRWLAAAGAFQAAILASAWLTLLH